MKMGEYYPLILHLKLMIISDIMISYGDVSMTSKDPRYAAEIRAKVDKIKLKHGCEICGYNAHPAALSFDHIDPSTKYRTRNGKRVNVADMVKGGRYGWQTIVDEIKKCRVLCMNCHMEVTHKRDTVYK